MKKLLEKILYRKIKKQKIIQERDALKQERDVIVQERDALMHERDVMAQERDALMAKVDSNEELFPPGHFYSPIPSVEDVNRTKSNHLPEQVPGIKLNTEKQLDLLREFQPYYNELPFTDHKTEGLRYYYHNPNYSYSDAIFLYCMIRHLKPKQLIEVGSGFSSCATLDTNELFFENSIRCTFIEPYPDLLKSLLKPEDSSRIEIIDKKLQDVPVSFFKSLSAQDILFIDSTHVSKVNSDVNYIIHEIFPNLNSGVYIHIHDVFYPFEYPKEWLEEGRAWNEQYILRAFLQFNDQFEIILFNTYLELLFRKELEERYPLLFKNPGGSLWLKRL